MTREGDFPGRREYPNRIASILLKYWREERCLGIVRLGGEQLHSLDGEHLVAEDDRKLIA
jgi:hypothetical protein